MSKPVILTGLRANNDLHIGNYFGALLPIIDMAKNKSSEFQINIFVPDLHSFTTPIDHTQLQSQIMDTLRLFVASELPLDHPDVYIYRQSYVPAHSELTWILDCFTDIGEMSRMTQFKDKAGIGNIKKLATYVVEGQQQTRQHSTDAVLRKSISVGLFNYPVLMAADILLYGAKYVPVGDDQSQHIEFARDIGERLNNKFGQELFTLPEPVQKQHEFFGKDQGLRIKDLQDPSRKMSKSEESGKGVIFLNDTPEAAHQKVMSAATDSLGRVSYDLENQPGIANLIQIYGLLTGRATDEVASEFEGQTQYGEFKRVIADKMAEFIQEFQAQLAVVDQSAIDAKLKSSEESMNTVANQTLLQVQKAVGLR